jgi:hypothetical protein
VIAQDSGNRYTESLLAASLSRLEAGYGDPLAALEYVTLAIRNYHDSGNTTMMGTTLAVLAAFSDRLGRYELAATIAGFDRLGARAITGHRQPVEMSQALAVGVHHEFRPVKTLDATPGNLRPQTTSLVGRVSERAEVQGR